MTSTADAHTIEALPPQARTHLDRIEALVESPIRYVSVGTRRDQIPVDMGWPARTVCLRKARKFVHRCVTCSRSLVPASLDCSQGKVRAAGGEEWGRGIVEYVSSTVPIDGTVPQIHLLRIPIMPTIDADSLTVAAVQMAPVWLHRERTIAKVVDRLGEAARRGAQLVTFGEALVPGYPFWLERTDGARFESAVQKAFHAHYLDQAVQIEAGHLRPVCDAARASGTAVVLGCMERPADRGGHSLYASLVYIDTTGTIGSVHRKLMPTYEERLSWSPGDGHGLRTHRLGAFTVGGLNCWENWMPLARTALYAQGEDLHVAIWPGGMHNTGDITRFIAREARSYVISVCGVMRRSDIPDGLPQVEMLRDTADDVMASGGTCIAAPDGSWLVAPVADEERIIITTLDHASVRQERQNFDAVGHYARPDVLHLVVNRERQAAARFTGEQGDPTS